jgi:hypothetical protein
MSVSKNKVAEHVDDEITVTDADVARARAQRDNGGGPKVRQFKNGKQQDIGDNVIIVEGGKLHENASKAEAILIAAGVSYYVRDGSIVRPIIEEVPAFRGRKTKAVRLREVTPDMLRDQLSRQAIFQKWNGRAKKFVEVDPPHDIANILLSRDGDWRFAPLAGVITTPTMRHDGSILSEAGYDQTTKLLLVAPPVMPPIPERPNRDEALVALKQLDDLLNEFPFVNERQ